jgi:hypothetical protein
MSLPVPFRIVARLLAAARNSPGIGRTVAMIRQVAGGAPDELVIVDNWFEELKAKQRK